MLGYANKIDIVNEASGQVIYSTGYRLYKEGSGETINIELGTGNTVIRVVANDGVSSDMGFKCKLYMHNNKINQLEIKSSKPNKK